MDIVGMHAVSKGDQVALIEGERELTWSGYRDERNRLANALLGAGIGPGDVIIQYLHNSIESAVASAASTELKATSTPINHRLKAPEVSYIIENSGARAVITEADFLPVIEDVREGATSVKLWLIKGEDLPGWAEDFEAFVASASDESIQLPEGAGDLEPQAMIYTSGTTGKPKGARRGGITSIQTVASWIQGFGLTPTDVHLVAGPLYHSAPLAFFAIAQALGNTSVIMGKFSEEEALRLIAAHGVNSTFMAPTLVKRILHLPDEIFAKYDTSSLRTLIVAGAPCPQQVKEGVMERFGPVLYEFYGSTELGLNTLLRPEDSIRKPGSCGQALPGVEIKLVDEEGNEVGVGEPGELYVKRNAMTFNEYHGNREATEQAAMGDWVTVGDVAFVDEDGFYYICDRKIDMIISGGVNIYPAEIEDALHRHPKIRDVAVFGIPNEEWGEQVHAAVQLRDGEELTAEELIGWARENMADYKVPRSVGFHDEFPRDVAGKLLKRDLKAPYWEGRASKV